MAEPSCPAAGDVEECFSTGGHLDFDRVHVPSDQHAAVNGQEPGDLLIAVRIESVRRFPARTRGPA